MIALKVTGNKESYYVGLTSYTFLWILMCRIVHNYINGVLDVKIGLVGTSYSSSHIRSFLSTGTEIFVFYNLPVIKYLTTVENFIAICWVMKIWKSSQFYVLTCSVLDVQSQLIWQECVHTNKMAYFSIIGRSVILRHIRRGVELPPIDQNLFYDFDYQLTNHITPRVVLPVSIRCDL